MSTQRMAGPDPEHCGIVVGYGAPTKLAFAGALDALLQVVREVTGRGATASSH